MKTQYLICILLVIVIVVGCQPVPYIQNPYSSVDWSNFGHYKANLHTHTMVRGGWMNPQTVVRKYKKSGYSILAITDHGSVTYPWEEFSRFKADERTKVRITDKVLKPQEEEPMMPDEIDFKDVNPSEVGMVAIQGNETSYKKHDVNSFFNDYNGKNSDETLDEISAKGGLAVLNHPGRYKFPVGWYVDLYNRYDALVGMDVFNCGNRYPNDRQLWDSILTKMAPVRPVWGFSDDDMHSMRDFGRNWNVFLLPELNDQQVRQAMEKGIFYIVNAPERYNGPMIPVINSISVNQRRGKIEINASECDSIIWLSGGRIINKGSQFSLRSQTESISYVRAELFGAGNSIVCTQPFYIIRKE